MPTYTFIKIVNNNNPSQFKLDLTSMTNHKSRISTLKTQFINHLDYGIGKNRDVYNYFTMDYSFYRVGKRDFPNLASAKIYKDELEKQLINERINKMKTI